MFNEEVFFDSVRTPEILSEDSTGQSPRILLTRPDEYYQLSHDERFLEDQPKSKNYRNKQNRITRGNFLNRKRTPGNELLQTMSAQSPDSCNINPYMKIVNPTNIKFSDMMDKYNFVSL